MIDRIIHVLPKNPRVSGGIKVHYQLSDLERKDRGYESHIAYEDLSEIPTWFDHDYYHLTFEQARAMITPNTVVVGWEDCDTLRSFAPARLVSYIQGEIFVSRAENFSGIGVWFSSKWNMGVIRAPGILVNPFVDRDMFTGSHFYTDKLKVDRELRVVLQERKDGKWRLNQVLQYLPASYRDRIVFKVLPDMPEKEFAENLREADVYFVHSYPEGFQLTALEAMASATLVVGYSGGGGTDFMTPENCYLCRDGSPSQVANALVAILNADRKVLHDKIVAGVERANWYSKEHTTEQLREAFSVYGAY